MIFIQLQSWMLPAALMFIGLILIGFDSGDAQDIRLPGNLFVIGWVAVIFGFGMLTGVFLP